MASLVPSAPLELWVQGDTPEREVPPAPKANVALKVFVACQALRATKEIQATLVSPVTSAPQVPAVLLDRPAQKAQKELEASRARKGLKGTVALLARMDEQGLRDHTASQAHRVRQAT